MKLIAWGGITLHEDDVKDALREEALKGDKDSALLDSIDKLDFYDLSKKSKHKTLTWEELQKQCGIDFKKYMPIIGSMFDFGIKKYLEDIPFLSKIEGDDYYSVDYRRQAVGLIMTEYYDLSEYGTDYGSVEDYCIEHDLPTGAYILCGKNADEVFILGTTDIFFIGTLYEGENVPQTVEIDHISVDVLYLREVV